jgi:hypothetical protein
VDLRLTFKDGGAFDFHTIFEQIKERVHQAYTVARESGQRGSAGGGLADVHLEQLPAYEAASQAKPSAPDVQTEEAPTIISPIPVRPSEQNSGVAGVRNRAQPSTRDEQAPAPDDPPPGYEEAQSHAVSSGLARRLTEQAEQSERQQ